MKKGKQTISGVCLPEEKERDMMLSVTAANIFVCLDYVLEANGKLLILSIFNEDSMSVNGVFANAGLGYEPVRIIEDDNLVLSFDGKMELESYYAKIPMGRENIYQGIAFSSLIGKEFLFLHEEDRYEDFYSYLMEQFTFPLLREWMPYIWEQARDQEFISAADVRIIGETGLFEGYQIFRAALTNDDLRSMLQTGLLTGAIHIVEEKQKPLSFQDMDDYFKKYGHTLVDNLEKLLSPLSPMKEKVDEITFINKRPFPQQAAIINGAVECLNTKNYTFLIESMGAGKTLQGMGVAEAFFHQEYLKRHPGKQAKELYLDGRLVQYRVIIMCPPHLVEKWEQSIIEEIPYARVEVIESLSQLVELRERGKEPSGKEYYILSKDSGKLSYSYAPVPYRMKKRRPKIPVCSNCRKELYTGGNEICSCGCGERELEEQAGIAYGLVCPECGELLTPADGRKLVDEATGTYRILLPEDFAQQTAANHSCRCCRTALWAPSCEPVDDRILIRKPKAKKQRWKKISHFANRAMKGRKSVWVMESREEIYKSVNEVTDEEIEDMDRYGPRRFGLTRYIKKYLRGFWDLAIFDEVQEYKAGGSAQGYAMHDLIKASRKQLALTGTIAGGYASDLFYTLYRLDPARMRKKGYAYGSMGERKFVEKYGTLETVFELVDKGSYHAMTRGKVVAPTRCMPGISVLVFTEFLLDTSLFLDLSDLSRYLPKLYEEVVVVPLEEEIMTEYVRVRQILKEEMTRNKDKLLMGSFLQFSLSYTDMPYKRPEIRSPSTGNKITEPMDLSFLVKDGALLNKEKKLAELVNQEQGENRNCFIYCEYTGEGDETISYRLKEVLEKNCQMKPYEAVVIESSYPAAAKREAWMHQKAAEGARVFITNAKCVATGLDFAFHYLGKKYNYPTIIFYQTGYDMIKIWQASHRHYRLNQTEECRTFFLVSERTIQLDAVQLVATKEVATSAIQGQFSSEGLSAMARGVDPRVILAQSVAEKSEKKEQGLRKMMDVLNQRNNQDKGNISYEKMPIFSEFTGLAEVPLIKDPMSEFEWATGQDIMDLISFEFSGETDEEEYLDVISEELFSEDRSEERQIDEGEIQDPELEGLLELIFL